MVLPPADVDLGKLSYEMFSLLLRSKFLFGESVPGTPDRPVLSEGGGRVRVLTIDGCGPSPDNMVLAAVALCGHGGVQAAMLFPRGKDGREVRSGGRASARGSEPQREGRRVERLVSGTSVPVDCGEAAAAAAGVWGRNAPHSKTPSHRYSYDLTPAAPFLFSSTHDVERDSFNFCLYDVCWTSNDGACSGASRTRRTEKGRRGPRRQRSNMELKS
jgi:hypothetical protein